MKELIEQITGKYGISAERATGILATVKEYVEQKVPGLGNSLDSIFQSSPVNLTGPAIEKKGGFLEKATHYVEDHIPAGMKEKAEEALEGVGGKIKSIFQ